MIDPQFFDMAGDNTSRAQRKRDNKWIYWFAAGIICCVTATVMFFGVTNMENKENKITDIYNDVVFNAINAIKLHKDKIHANHVYLIGWHDPSDEFLIIEPFKGK